MTAADRYPKTVVLADGAHLVLRLPTDADTSARHALRGAEPGGGPSTGAAKPALVVVACDGARIAGELRLTRDGGSPGDTVVIEVTLDPAYRGRRLGTWMLLDGIHAAEHLGAARLVAEAADGDGALEGALVRLDFFEEPSPRDGRRTSNVPSGAVRRMVKRLHGAWTDF